MSDPSDLNDLAASKGPDAVRAVIEGAVKPAGAGAQERAGAKNVIPLRGEAQPTKENSTAGESGDDDLPTIVYQPGDLPSIIDQAEAAIMALPGEPRIYQRGGALVRIVRRGPTSARNIKRSSGGLAIVPVDVPQLVELMTAAAIWLRPVKSKGDGQERYRTINAPHEAAAVLLARAAWKFPPLTGILEAPTLRPDGSVLQVPGYDQSTGLYLDVGDTVFEHIPEHPVDSVGVAGLNEHIGLLSEFPFASDVDRSVALAAILTGVVGPALPGRPLIAISARVMGTGKTLLAQVIAQVVNGRPAPVIAPPKDAKEEDKTIFSALLEGDSILIYDNVEHQLSSDLLCAVITSPVLRGRVLGSSKTVTVSTACTFIATGNNLTIAGDLTARSLICLLDAKSDHPEHRRFSRDLMQWIPQERGRLVPAALAFLRAFLCSGETPTMEPWQRFPEWDRLIRASLIWAGLPDPLLALRQGEANDPRRLEHEAVMQAWTDAFGDKPTSVRDALKVADSRTVLDDFQLRDALLDVAGERGEVNARRLGRWFMKMQGRIQAGLKIERGGVVSGGQTWKVTP